MKYRTFGRSAIQLSVLGFGAMRLPKGEDEAIRILHRAFDRGVNYVDTAAVYGDSEIKVGRALATHPNKSIYLSTKNHLVDNTREGWRARLETSLSRLGVSHIHFYQVVHGLSWDVFEHNFSKSGALDEAIGAREEGLIGHICFSFHDSAANLIKLIDTGVFDGVTVQYNLLDRTNEDAISYASEKGMGVIVMGPVGGGRLMSPSESVQRAMGASTADTPQIALRFVLAHPGVTCAISGMSTSEMVDQNCTTASDSNPYGPEEWQQALKRADELKRLSDLYCTGCGYCTPCPNDVNIPENFRLMNLHQVWEQTSVARKNYAKLGQEGWYIRGKPAKDCLLCGECEPKCPQKIPIMEQLKATAEALQSENEHG